MQWWGAMGLVGVVGLMVLGALGAIGVGAAGAVPLGPHPTGGGGCPDVNGIGNFQASSLVGASVTNTSTSYQYFFSSLSNLNPTSGVPGLIAYCVYAGSSAPTSIAANATGSDGSAWTTVTKTSQGYLAFERPKGDPSNIGLDGTTGILIGTASWSGGAPSPQTILLHINDAKECQSLYGGTGTTCFVYPSGAGPICDGTPVCKVASIAEATAPLTVPAKTVLHISWTFTIVNQPTNNFSMEFPYSTYPSNATTGTGLRDTFNCGEVPDPNGSPGADGSYSNYQSTGFDLAIGASGMPCSMQRVILTNSGSTIVLTPGQSISFTLDMVDPGFLVRGMHCLNYGINLRWVQSDDGLVHAFHAPDVDVLVT